MNEMAAEAHRLAHDPTPHIHAPGADIFHYDPDAPGSQADAIARSGEAAIAAALGKN